MVATLARNRLQRKTCRYCGVETETGGNHSCERECVEALAAEVMKAKRLLGDARNPVSPGAPGGRRAGG